MAGSTAQDPPEATWAVDGDVVGVVVAGLSVVEGDEGAEVADVDRVDAALVGVVVAGVVVAGVVVALLAEWCDVCADANPAKTATPAREAPATAPVTRRLRRKIASRKAEEVMQPLSATRLGGT